MSPPVQATAPRPLSPIFRDLAVGLGQQMFFWGKDVEHPEGNIFVRNGFKRSPSPGIQGASCYRLPWQDGAIELHGSYAGWLTREGGMLFIRPLGRCVRWLDSAPPIPGEWSRERFVTNADESLHASARPFLNWWLAHEKEVLRQFGAPYREACHQQHMTLPKAHAWLSPQLAMQWVAGLRDHPGSLPRARHFAESYHS